VQERCPNCGGYFVAPVVNGVHGIWVGLATYWVVQCCLFILVAGYRMASGLESWQYLTPSDRWVVAGAFALLLGVVALGAAPFVVIDRINKRADQRAYLRRCRTCGYRWDARAVWR